MKHILLTGSGGFIGRYLKLSLEPLGRVFCPRSSELNLLDGGSVRDYIARNQIDFIVHSAAAGVRISGTSTVQSVLKPNLEMFDNLACLGIPMITFGSGAEYDKRRDLCKVKEEDFGLYIPEEPYGLSKYLISKKIEKLSHVLNLRIFGIYGVGEHPSRLTSYIIRQIINKQPVFLNQNAVYDFLYIYDFCTVVQAFVRQFPKEKFINITPTQSIELLDLVHKMIRVWGADIKVCVKNQGLNKEYTGDNSLLLYLLPRLTFTSYADGFCRMKQKIQGSASLCL